jgi:acyl carrier protein
VLARRDGGGDARLVAYVVPAAGGELTAEGLREDLKRMLPGHLLPSATVFLDALPLTPNGKVDRRALPAPQARDVAREGYVAPSDPVEETLAAIWAEVLGIERVGARDDFFALGGHSLLATRVMSRVREALDAELPLRALFEQPTVAQLAGAVRSARAEAGLAAPPLIPMPPRSREGDLPLSFAQQRLWFLDQLEPDSPAYNVPMAVRLTGELSVEALERTCAEIVRRHETLRTVFTRGADQPAQVVRDAQSARPELPVLDLSEAPEEARAEWELGLALEEARQPFDLARGPLLRLALVRRSAREHLLLATLHHIISDGWSMGVLLREVAALYDAFVHGRPSPLPELPVQYADFAVWQRSWMEGEVLEGQLAYWKEALAGAPTVLELPTDRPRPAMQTSNGAAAGDPRALPARGGDPVHAPPRRLGSRAGPPRRAG